MSDATEICARLLREGTVARGDLADLDLPEVRIEVERRLGDVGLVLATSAYSDHVGIRLAPDIVSRSEFDAASNLGLRSDACALLAILWFRLVLRKRTVIEERAAPGQASLVPEDRVSAARSFDPEVRIETIFREFETVFRSRTNLLRLVAQLRNLGFLKVRAGRFLQPGPLLELAIDGEKMMAFVRTRVLGDLLATKTEEAAQVPSVDPEDQLFSQISKMGGDCQVSELSAATGQPPRLLRILLKHLIEEGRVEKLGERGETHYKSRSRLP